MARRKKDPTLVAVMASVSFEANISIGVGAYFGMRTLVPWLLAGKPLLAGIAGLCHSMAWLALAFFGFTALLAVIRTNQGKTGISIGPSPVDGQPLPPAPVVKGAPNVASSPNAYSFGASPQPAGWTVDALRSLEWKRFELTAARYYELVGFQAETLPCGPDGGIDVKLFKLDNLKPIAIVQCKAWNSRPVGVKEVRELLGVMTHEKVARGIFLATGSYTPDAAKFGVANPVQMLDGADFIKKVLGLPPAQQSELLRFAFEGDYRTPTCASCGIKLVRREGKRGAFWGCTHYPRCKTMMVLEE